MEEFTKRLTNIPGSYFNFVVGIITYAKKNPQRMNNINKFLDEHPDATTSDIVYFVINQPDFHDDGLGLKKVTV